MKNFTTDLILWLEGYTSFQFEIENTLRMKKAIESGLLNAVAHPTNRMIFVRKSIDLDLEEIFKTASKEHVALEVNLFPTRMDLSSSLNKRGKEKRLFRTFQ